MKRASSFKNGSSKHRVVDCPICGKQIRSDNLKRHLPTHNNNVNCTTCKKTIRSDLFFKHKLLCEANLDESLCNRYSGVHKHLVKDDSCSSVSGFFKSLYELQVDKSADYDRIILDSITAAKPKILHFLSQHPIKE